MAEGWDISTATFNRGAGYFDLSRETSSPQEVFFKPDGTKMYVAEDSSKNIIEYDLSSAWDVSTATYLRGFGTYDPDFINISSLFFKPDGTKMYVVDDYYDDLREYDLSTPWDVSSASYNQEFYLGGVENLPQSIFFKPDGTKLYVVGYQKDAVHEYDLSVAWDISTATLLQTFSVSAQETTPTGLFFKSDGTKMYITGTTGDDVNEYDLSVAWDVSTATYLQNFSVSGQDSIPAGVTFKSDGTKMYISGVTNDAIWEYDLSTPWDVSTATFPAATENYFSVSAQSSATEDVTFKPDGTKMYVLDAYAGLFEYDLSSAWDITSASYLQTLDITTVNSRALATVFKPDGTKMYVVDYDGEDINQYDLSSAWDISTAVYLQDFSVSGQESGPTGLAFKPDGTKMYIVGGAGDEVNEYDLSTPWDITTAVYLQNFSVSSQDLNPLDLVFKPDGTKMYITGFDGEDVNEYDLSTPWDISTASYSQNLSFSSRSSDPRAVAFKSDGTKMYMVDNAGDAIFAYDLDVIPEPAAWNVAGLSGDFGSYGYFSVAEQELLVAGMFFKPDGTKMYIIGSSGDDVNEYDLSTPWDILTAVYLQRFSVNAQETSPQGVFFKPDGTKMYITGNSGDDVNEYDLSSAWDISTASYLQNFSVSAQELGPQEVFFKPDGTKMYVLGYSGIDVNEYDLSSAWDISTASYVQRFAVGSQTGQPTSVSFKPDGTKMYVVGQDVNVVFEYDLSTPWDVSTAVWRIPAQDTFGVGAQDTGPVGVFFKPDGTKMYVAGTTSLVTAGDAIHEYDLGTAWDVTTATYLQSYDPPDLYPAAFSDVHFKPDGTKMFITDYFYRLIYAYSLSTPWDISTASYSEGRTGSLSEGPESIFFKPDGTKMYVVSDLSNSVWQYSLSTPWDVSTATIINYIGIGYREGAPTGLAFKSDGTKMYLTGSGDDVLEYDLGTPWDTATASFALRRPLMTLQTSPTGLFFKPDGNEVFVVGSYLDAVLKYTLLDGGISVTLTGVESQMSVDSVTLSLGASVTVAGLSSTLTVDNATIYLLTPVTVTGVEGRTGTGTSVNWGLIIPDQDPNWTLIVV